MWKKLGLPKVVPYLGAAAFLVEVQAAVHVHVARQGMHYNCVYPRPEVLISRGLQEQPRYQARLQR